ncbi:MAG: hypothetical protein ACN6O6_20545 [Pseudomonas sp.]|uniref:hypothetical protein n=1 Tax=Pseudomonas sp. TaxID=306 RepID=UPI003D09792F
MKSLNSFLTAVAFSLAGVAVHANAASENQRGESGLCFQVTPLAGKGSVPTLTESGASRTPLGQKLERVVEDGFSRTPQGMQSEAVASNGFSRTPLGRWVDERATTKQA